MKKSRKWVLLFFALLILGAAGSLFYVRFHRKPEEREPVREAEALSNADYSAEEEIAAAKRKLEEDPGMPGIVTGIHTIDKKIALCFEGEADRLALEQILAYLDEHEMTAAFFISAVDAGEDQEIIREILKAGHDVGSYTLYGTSHMEKLSSDELITDFCRAQAVYADKISERPEFLKCNATEYTDELLETAEACGYKNVVYPTQYLNYQSFEKEKTAENYVSGLDRGAVVSIKLNGYLDELEYEEKKTEEDPAKDKQPGLELHEPEEEEQTETERLLQVVDWFLRYLDEKGYETVRLQELPEQDMEDLALKYSEVEEQYREEMEEPITAVHTRERKMAFTFRGLGDAGELTNVLSVLEEMDAKVTFFVTGQEIESYPEQVQQILDAGHEIGSNGYSGKSMQEMSFGEICEDIYKNDVRLKSIGIQTDLFKAPYDAVSENVQMAAAAMGKKIIGSSSFPTRTDYAEEKYTAQQIVQKYYGRGRPVFGRGEIVDFNMNVYDDETSVAQLVEALWESRVLPTGYGTKKENILQITTISDLMEVTE